MSDTTTNTVSNKRRFSGFQVFLIVLFAIVLTAAITVWLVISDLFATKFSPVTLDTQEQQVLNAKLQRIDPTNSPNKSKQPDMSALDDRSGRSGKPSRLEPEPYNEVGASREISLTEKELNAMLAKNTDLAEKMAIDLSGNLASAKLIIPVDEDFPVMGGKTLKVSAGLEIAYADSKPAIVLKGVSVWGVPIPNAWLGGLKNVDLVQQYGGSAGFWKSFSDGIDYIRVEEGELKIKLSE